MASAAAPYSSSSAYNSHSHDLKWFHKTHKTKLFNSGFKRQNRDWATVICRETAESYSHRSVVVGLAADSGCGKSTFMRRLLSVVGGSPSPSPPPPPPRPANPHSNTLVSNDATVICLDDYHSLDRIGRKEEGITALHPRANNFDLMYAHVKALKEGVPVMKPVYNHCTGLLDPPEYILPPKILIIEGLHPLYDVRVRSLLDFSIYLDISDEVKFAWKIQ
ncbi:hypothetical protein KI387_004144, partial [Taxus chinensis]